MRLALICFLMMVFVCGCYQAHSNGDEDLRAVPVTNNPNIVPERGMGPIQAIPY